MTLIETIDQDLSSAMKEKNEEIVSVLRLIKSSIKNWQIANKKEPEDADVLTILQKEIKTRKDSIEMYKQGNRDELAQKEEAEIRIIEKYLPEQMGEEEIRAKVQSAITSQGASGIQDMGKVMGVVMGELKGKADGTTVSKIVKEELTK